MTAVLGDALNDLQVACEELNRRGHSARMREFRYCGERELRLLVRQPGGRTMVEVLAPPEEADGDCWHVVRAERGRRTVWCGPSRAKVISGLDLVPVVVDMLTTPEATLAGRYRRCDAD